MNATIKQATDIMEQLGEAAQLSVLRFAESLIADGDEDIKLYDEANANDDGYRISAKDLRKKYGI